MGNSHKRYKRNDTRTVQITERDEAVLRALLRFNVLNTTHLHRLIGGGFDGFRRRLRYLFDTGYLARPPIRNEMGNVPMIYCLGKKGAEHLRVRCGLDVPKTIDWDRKANDRKGMRGLFLLEHDLGANGATIDLILALDAIEGIQVMSPTEIIKQSPEWTKKAKAPYSIPTRYQWTDGKLYERNIIPDGVIGYIDRRHKEPIKALLFVEYDQDTMSVDGSNPTQASIRQKVASYSAIFLNKTTKERFGFEHFRVLFITTGSEKHVTTMIDVCKEYRGMVRGNVPPYPFFFSTSFDVQSARNPLVDIWRDGGDRQGNITPL